MIGRLRGVAELVEGARAEVALATALALAQAAVLLPVALLVRHIFDVEVPQDAEGAIVGYGVLIVACYVLSAALGALGRARASEVARTTLGRVRGRLVAQLETLPLSWHDRHPAGAVHAVVVYDCDRVDRMLNGLLSIVLPAVAALAGLGIVAAALQPVLFATMALFVPPMVLLTRRFARAHEERLRTWHATAEAFSSHTQVLLAALPTIRAAGAHQRDRARFEREVDRFVEAGHRAGVSGARHQAVQGAVAAIAGSAVLVVGGVLVARGHLSLGSLLAFYAVVALMLRQLSSALAAAPVVLDGLVAHERVRELSAAHEPGAYAGRERLTFRGGVALEAVSFGYDRAPVLRDLELRVEPGELVCVVGANGAGKTTLMALVLGLYRPQSGEALADGVPLARLDLDDLRAQIGVILQDAVLFAGTVAENLTLGRPLATADERAQALRVATADEVVAALPDGLGTVLGDGGAGLSGGERQRLAIARAVLARPRLLMLDEPTAHLPAEVSARVVANLKALPWHPSVVVITHDEDVARGADRVLRLADGELHADGVLVER